eukprot:TRINITY_DN4476_c0_g1_i2.p1 TRINITY_DN4476_c0_g1~~TRINITY_DN4476_c0_g1_i2.p1  ORF type:complete len:200 (+),score=43.25 TRINITY_DN4476_c0_g1_i2:35-634(+)
MLAVLPPWDCRPPSKRRRITVDELEEDLLRLSLSATAAASSTACAAAAAIAEGHVQLDALLQRLTLRASAAHLAGDAEAPGAGRASSAEAPKCRGDPEPAASIEMEAEPLPLKADCPTQSLAIVPHQRAALQRRLGLFGSPRPSPSTLFGNVTEYAVDLQGVESGSAANVAARQQPLLHRRQQLSSTTSRGNMTWSRTS